MSSSPARGVAHRSGSETANVGSPSGPAWTEADAAVLAEADYAADRYAAWIRLASAAAIGLVLFGAIQLTQPTWNSYLVVVVLGELAIACGAVYLTQIRRFSAAVPWLLSAFDAGFLFGVDWFNPWFERLPQGYRAALVSPLLAFLLIALAAWRPRASTILVQTASMAVCVALVLWWPLRAVGTLAPRSESSSGCSRTRRTCSVCPS